VSSLIPPDALREAARRLQGRVHRTPLLSSRSLGDHVGASVFFKAECLQKTGSFKARGALNKVLSLTPKERARGIITVSAGNHAQAVAWAAAQVQAPCAVVMPRDAPRSKTDAVRGYGAEVIAHADRAGLFDRLRVEQKARGSVFVHPFDDPVVLCGAGTTGLEIVEDLPNVDMVLVPVGGGGLLGGVTSAVHGLRPGTRIVAVELEAGPGLGPALAAGKPVPVPRPYGTLADGMTPPFVGALPLAIAMEASVDVVTVSEAEIVNAMRFLYARAKLVVEASGAAAVAALLAGRVTADPGSRVACILSGGNIDLETVSRVLAG